MFAVIQVGSSQYKVSEGDSIDINRIDDKIGSPVNIDKVLLFSKDADVRVGKPYLKDVKVAAKVLKHVSGEKVINFKFRKRKDSKRKVGHRQALTTLSITKISG